MREFNVLKILVRMKGKMCVIVPGNCNIMHGTENIKLHFDSSQTFFGVKVIHFYAS